MRSPIWLTLLLIVTLLVGAFDDPYRQLSPVWAATTPDLPAGSEAPAALPAAVAMPDAWLDERAEARRDDGVTEAITQKVVLGGEASTSSATTAAATNPAGCVDNAVSNGQRLTSVCFPTGTFLDQNWGTSWAPNHRRVRFTPPGEFLDMTMPAGVESTESLADSTWAAPRAITRSIGNHVYQAKTFSQTNVMVLPAVSSPDSTPAGAYAAFLANQQIETLDGRIIVNGGLVPDSTASITATMTITGGRLNLQTASLKAQVATFPITDTTRIGGVVPGTDPNCEVFWTCRRVQDGILLAIDWGIGPPGDFQSLGVSGIGRGYALIYIVSETVAGTEDPGAIPLDDPELMSTVFPWPSLSAYNRQSVLESYRQQIVNHQLNLFGAVPEWHYLYDYSGYQTDWTTGKRFPSVTPDLIPYYNQYDVGTLAQLPIRNGAAGGNACGVASLSMALCSINRAPLIAPANGISITVADIYSNTMGIGLKYPNGAAVTATQAQGFFPDRAKTWLEGTLNNYPINYASMGLANIPGSAACMNAQGNCLIPYRPLFAAPNVTTTVKIDTSFAGGLPQAEWDIIDNHLHAHRPVLIRTTLTTGTGVGNGHYILLLGTGHNDYVGDYYIVADPAGHYFANPDKGGQNKGHYGTVAGLQQVGVGITHGGWFGIYPKASFQSATWVPDLRTMVLNDPAHLIRAVVHSPLNVLVTDPLGRRTGALADGVVVREIPGATYQLAWAEEEEDGPTYFLPDDPKTVLIPNPIPGSYQVDLFATGAGPYTFEWNEAGGGGQLLNDQSTPGTVQTGDHLVYHYNVRGNPSQADSLAQQVAELTNAERARQGLPPLKLQPNLRDAAMWFAQDMADQNYYPDHIDRFGRLPVPRLPDFDYLDRLTVAENEAVGYPTAAEVVAGWLNSPGHRANMLNPSVREIGVGYGYNASSQYGHYWLQDFGARNDIYPVVINGEAAQTGASAVSLYLYGAGWAQQMRLSNDGVTWTNWEPYQPNRNWTLAPGLGERTVYAELSNGSTTLSASDSIQVVAPTTPTPTATATLGPATATATGTSTPAATATQTPSTSPTATTTATATPAPKDFVIGLAPASQVLAPGSTTSLVVTLTSVNGFNTPVTLSVAGLPNGVTASFNPATVTPTGSATLTLTAAANAAIGTTDIAVTGTGGGIAHTTSSTLKVDFGLVPICYGTFSGGVTDSVTGQPVAGASVSGGGHTATTDANGRYTLTEVPLGSNNAPVNQNVGAQAAGYWQHAITATAACGQITPADIQLLAQRTGTLGGTVYVGIPDPNDLSINRAVMTTTTTLAGAAISLQGQALTTGQDGRYQSSPISLNTDNAPRTMAVTAATPGYWRIDRNSIIKADQNTVADFALVAQCTGSITGTVRISTTAGLAPMAHTSVSASEYGRFGEQLASYVSTTDDNGVFAFPTVLLGYNNSTATYYLSASGATVTTPLDRCVGAGFADIRIAQQAPPRVPNYGTVTGHVFDQDSGQPLGDASILVGGASATSAADGAYTAPNVFIGYDDRTSAALSIAASRTGYYGVSGAVTVTTNLTTTYDLRLARKRYGKIVGTVRDAVTHQPIVGAAIGLTGTAPTGPDGTYASAPLELNANLQPLVWPYWVMATGYWRKDLSVTVGPDQTVTVDVDLIPLCQGAAIAGSVVDAVTGLPIAGASVSATSSSGAKFTVTDAQGNFSLTNLTVGTDNSPTDLTVSVSATGYLPQSKTVKIFCGASLVVEFGRTPSATGTITGTVTNRDTGQPLASVFIGSEFGGSATTNAQGSYTLSNVPLGANGADRTWQITAVPTGFTALSQPVTARANTTVTLNFSFGAPSTPTATATPTASPTATSTSTPIATATPTSTATATATLPAPTATNSPTTTATPTATPPATATNTATPTTLPATATSTATAAPTTAPTATLTPTLAPTATSTASPTVTATATLTPSASPTATGTATTTRTATVTSTTTATATATATPTGTVAEPATALVRHGLLLNGTGRITGSVHQLLPENATLNGNAAITGQLLVPGSPSVQLVGQPTFGGTVPGLGNTSPTTYTVTLNGNATLGQLLTRRDPVPLPTVAAPPLPTGNRDVVITLPGQSIGDPTTLRNLTLNGSVGSVALPPGTYGAVTVNGSSTLVLGTSGATQPAVYHLQALTLNGTVTIRVVGPVSLTLANGTTFNGPVGEASQPGWLTLRVAAGGVTLNGQAHLEGRVVAPASRVILNGQALLRGGLVADSLTINSGTVELLDLPSANLVSHEVTAERWDEPLLSLLARSADALGAAVGTRR